MPTGIEIASIVMASTGMGGSAISTFANFTRKGAAWKTYDQVVQQYTQLKALREDVAVNQYLSPDDKKELDDSIHAIAFDLMELQSALQELRGTAYYKITTYPAKWFHFNDRAGLALKLIVQVNLEIMQRSTQGREQTRLDGMTQATCQPTSQASSGEESVVINQGLASGDFLSRQIVDATATSAVAALRLSLEGGVKLGSPALCEDGGISLPSESKKVMKNSLKPGFKWQISPKCASALPSLAVADNIELKDWAREIAECWNMSN